MSSSACSVVIPSGDLEHLEIGGRHRQQIGLCAAKHAGAEDHRAGEAHDWIMGFASRADAAAGH
ncbi:Uncharacterised protein [Mycobacterium tuberculosis]|nr:Uncharacterised protein [Mycobacterium tuberculosis]